MRTQIKLVLIIVFLSTALYGQGLNNYWLLGYFGSITGGNGNLSMNFDSLPVTAYRTPRKMNFNQTNASISDKRGRLLFYTNGGWIANAQNDSMLNGRLPVNTSYNALGDGEQVPQECLIIPDPLDTSIYYMFYNHIEYMGFPIYFSSKALLYCKIDMNLDSGLGGVIQKNSIAINDTIIEGEITACKHANGRDWWIICHRIRSTLFYKFLLTPNGLSPPISQNIGDTLYFGKIEGQVAFSPDGTKYASYHPRENDLNVLDFDRCSGNFSNPIHIDIDDSAAAGGVAFSQNSQFLYVTSTRYVYQFKLNASNLDSTRTIVATWDGTYSPHSPLATSFYLSQLAPDGKIYINSTNSVDVFNVINSPDSAGLSCNLTQHSFQMPALNSFTIPNHPNYFLGADSGSVCDTLQLGIKPSYFSSTNNKFSIFPNPAKDIVQLSYTPTGKARTIEIRDVNGKIVFRSSIPQWSQLHRIDVSSLNSGVYLCRFVDEKEGSTKFVVERD